MGSFVPNFEQGPYSGIPSPTQSLEFPALYDLSSAQGAVFNAPENQPVLGINGEGEPLSIDLDGESPHILVSAATGGGKSTIQRSIAAQILRNGGVATVLDVKMHSHRWAKNLPNVGYAQNMTEVGNALVELGREVHRRNAIVNDFPGPIEEAPVGPRLVVVFEELNATMGQLKELTRRIPQGTYDAVDAFRDLVFMG